MCNTPQQRLREPKDHPAQCRESGSFPEDNPSPNGIIGVDEGLKEDAEIYEDPEEVVGAQQPAGVTTKVKTSNPGDTEVMVGRKIDTDHDSLNVINQYV